MELTLQVWALYNFVGVFITFLWMYFCIRPLYTWMDNHFGCIHFDKNISFYSILTEYDIIGKRRFAVLNGILLILPYFIIAFIVPHLIYANSFAIYGLFVAIAILTPVLIMFYRDDVFNMMVKHVQEGDIIKFVYFYDGKYPANFTGMLNLVNMWCCIFFGFLNYYDTHDLAFLGLTLYCLMATIMLLIPDKMDKVLPLDLKTGRGWWTFAIILTSLSIVLSFGVYSMVMM